MRRLTVSAHGGGDFRRIQDALNSIPDDCAERTVIAVMNGTYREKLRIDKPFVSLIGQDASRTIVTYDDFALKTFADGELYHAFHSYTLLVAADDFTAERLTFENKAGAGEDVGQALAAYVDADRVCFRACRFIGLQDTLFTGPLPPAPRDRPAFGGPRDLFPRRPVRQYYERCTIEGDVDFIFGSATAVFSDCDIVSRRPGWITAASTPKGARYGYVFAGCRLIGDAPEKSVYLGRPWRNDAKVVFLDCWLGGHIAPEGWSIWNEAESLRDVEFAEFGSCGPGADGGSRVGWSKRLTREEAAAYSVQRVLAGNDGWDPEQPYDGWRPSDRGASRPISIFFGGRLYFVRIWRGPVPEARLGTGAPSFIRRPRRCRQ
ncbi:pectinesterase family protein [Cohnella ginsengisoli]|uniref:Pectinesterase n=1 Tax=Cohnella ginsengisoli TaxID=425004 RepID=A0A9X4KHN0_9BACL|nr:pectinesterase family protein [Cohnella ginsengisoli]MDG0792160.1 pectinesterase family protein [Cohnella ginsengisoli]